MTYTSSPDASNNCLSTAGAALAEVLVTTDVCLKAFEEEDHAALNLSLLVNYTLPTRKARTMYYTVT